MSKFSRKEKRGLLADIGLLAFAAATAITCFWYGQIVAGAVAVIGVILCLTLITFRNWAAASLARKTAELEAEARR